MENTVNKSEAIKPNTKPLDSEQEAQATIPSEKQKICVKFNKEEKLIDLDEATVLAQKGLKLESVTPTLERIKALAAAQNLSLNDYLLSLENAREQTRLTELTNELDGNAKAAERIMGLESELSKSTPAGFSELQREFPNIKSEDELPAEVLERARESGNSLLTEYLKYENARLSELGDVLEQGELAKNASVGAQQDLYPETSPLNEEFLRGLWGR